MKRILMVMAILLIAGSVMAQTHFPSWTGGLAQSNTIKIIPLMGATEKDYVTSTIAEANDTSLVYVLPPFDRIYLLTKVSPAAAQDSVNFAVFVEGKFTDELMIGFTTRCNGWLPLDSTYIATADTVGGDLKEIKVPGNVNQIRVIWDGVTDNHPNIANPLSSWIILKY